MQLKPIVLADMTAVYGVSFEIGGKMGIGLISIIIGIITILIDQITKAFIVLNLYRDEIVLIDKILSFTYVENYGAAWGFFNKYDILLKILIPIFILAIIVFLIRSRPTKFETFAGSLVVGGAVGNYIDRLIRGYVVDFIDFKFWPVFNFADICIVVGCIMLVISYTKKGDTVES